MFTGIVEKTGRVRQPGERLLIDTGYADLVLGESVGVNGCCLTVAELESDTALFFLSRETLARTNLGSLQAGEAVNLERAVQAGARLSGHIVQGHIDGMAKLSRIEARGECHELEFSLAPSLGRYLVEKGSIAVDGASLTLNRVRKSGGGQTAASVMIIPHTWAHTTFPSKRIGDRVNIEIDILAKYTEQLCQPYRKPLNT